MTDEELATGSEAGSGDPAVTQVAEGGSQESAQSQSSESVQVEGGESQASSKSVPARNNSNWAQQRILEKSLGKLLSSKLDERLNPILERLSQIPRGNTQQPQTEEFDYNDLQGSITRLVKTLLEEQGKTVFPKLKEELQGEFKSTTKMQEARNFLVSQPDIGNNKSRLSEIHDIIANDILLYNSLEKYPLEVIQEAATRWRSSKKNPNVPGQDELSTVTGGTGTAQRRTGQPSIQKLRELQNKVIGNLPAEEREKLNREIELLMSAV